MRYPNILSAALAVAFISASLGSQSPPATGTSQQGGRGGVPGQAGGRGAGGGRATTAINDGEECPSGMTEIRPRSCMAPEFPPPSIVDYRPVSTLRSVEHKMTRAKFPAIDFHAHVSQFLGTQQGIADLKAHMDSLNLGMMVVADNVSGDRLRTFLANVAASPLKDRVRILTGVNFRGVGTPGWAAQAVKQLDDDIAAGAVGVGEIGKGFGLSTRKADGSLLRIDDPELDPVWEECARLGIPVFIHTAEPEEFFQPIDYHNERWLELSLFNDRRNGPGTGRPTFEELMTARDNLFRRHPNVTFVAAHMGWHANDLARLGKMFDEMPNLYTEMGAVLYDVGRQPRAAHDFFTKYQDRILFGKDSFQPEEYPYYWRVFETNDDYFDYYRPYHAFWKLYGIGLPDEVLRKVYYGNALKITPKLPRDGFPR
ncbi:MAG: amidohydrolase family protein [Gemmatimonadaceae bacterium]|nr:amidohydrolase family protein [Gemmatimonadaceae bacterium]